LGFLVFLLTSFENDLEEGINELYSRKFEMLVVLGGTFDLGLVAVVSDFSAEESPLDIGVVGSNTCASTIVVLQNRNIKTQVFFNCFITERRLHKFANKYPTLVGTA